MLSIYKGLFLQIYESLSHSSPNFIIVYESSSHRRHCVKCVLVRGYSGPYFPVFRLNTDQNNFEYEHLRSGIH